MNDAVGSHAGVVSHLDASHLHGFTPRWVPSPLHPQSIQLTSVHSPYTANPPGCPLSHDEAKVRKTLKPGQLSSVLPRRPKPTSTRLTKPRANAASGASGRARLDAVTGGLTLNDGHNVVCNRRREDEGTRIGKRGGVDGVDGTIPSRAHVEITSITSSLCNLTPLACRDGADSTQQVRALLSVVLL